MFNSVNQSVPSSALTVLTFDSERFDTDNIHDNAVNNSRLTCNTPGKYQISATVSFADNGEGGTRILFFRLNGVTIIASQSATPHPLESPEQPAALTPTTLYDLVAGAYVEVLAFQDSGAPMNVLALPNSSAEFMMAKVA